MGLFCYEDLKMKYYFYLSKDKDKHEKHHDHGKSYDGFGDYERDFECVEHVLMDNPETWAKYAKSRDGWMDTISMEMSELRHCKVDGDYNGIVQNLLHVAAACIKAHHTMTCDRKADYDDESI